MKFNIARLLSLTLLEENSNFIPVAMTVIIIISPVISYESKVLFRFLPQSLYFWYFNNRHLRSVGVGS